VRRAALVAAVAGALVAPTCAAAMAGPPVPDLRLGSTGGSVANWQHIVNTWLGASGTARARHVRRLAEDGIFGRATEAATRAFQRDVRVPATGVVDGRTMLVWIGANVTCCGAGYHRVGPGSADGYVGWWQVALDRWLAKRGARQLLVDCVFGPMTRAATFQHAVGLRATGIAGQATWAAMARRNFLQLP
jgi:peptidoglycan hydrolase-like protein with peptidoglycan-binding domain